MSSNTAVAAHNDVAPPGTHDDHVIEIAFGSCREDKHWRTRKLKMGDLIAEHFTPNGWKRGIKDGPAITQGSLAGPQRKAKAVKSCSIVMLDHDTGETMDEVAAAIEARGLYAILWHTHSHLKPVSEIPESKLVQFLRKDSEWAHDREPSDDPEVLAKQCADYLRKIKKFAPHVVESISDVKKQLTGKGMLYHVTHAPLHRLRSLLVRDEPFDFAAQGTQDERIAEWKDRHAGLSAELGLVTDPSTVDPSRLMYLPRIACDADESLYHIREIPGRLLTLEDMPRLSDLQKGKAANDMGHPNDTRLAPRHALDDLARAADRLEGGKQQFKTPGLKAWLAKHANDFEIEEFLEAHGSENRGPTTTGTCFECPTDELHSDPGNPNDKGFWAQNASAREGGFACACSHATCRAAAIEATGKVDRAWFIDEFCASHGLGVDDLLEYCPNHMREEDERIAGDEKRSADVERAISALNKSSTDEAVLAAIAVVAAMPANPIKDDSFIKQIHAATDRSKTILSNALKTTRKEASKGGGGGGDGDDNTIRRDNHPVPNDPGAAAEIWATWPFDDQIACARARFKRMNDLEPTVFVRPEGGKPVRIQHTATGLRLVEMSDSCQYRHELHKRMRFMVPDPADPEGKNGSAFPHIVDEFMGSVDIRYPLIERVISVPVFDATGALQTSEGYDPNAKAYLYPNAEFWEVPEIVTDDHVADALDWLFEMLRDIPFSDSFAPDADEPPQYVVGDDGELLRDENGDPMPDWERGKSSRVAFIAEILQTFVRAMINGPCPFYHHDKALPGEGGSLLNDIVSLITTGEPCAVISIEADNEEEHRKTTTAQLKSGSGHLAFDNIELASSGEAFDSGPMCNLATSGVWTDRVLGKSETIRIKFNGVASFTGNGAKFSTQLLRRLIGVLLKSGYADPAEGRAKVYGDRAFKHPELQAWVLANRCALVWSCHVLIRNWVQKGKPAYTARSVASFEGWTKVMGGILEAAGLDGFLDSRDAYLKAGKENGGGDPWTPFVRAVREKYDGEWKAAGELLEGLGEAGLGSDPMLPVSFPFDIPLSGRNRQAQATSLGRLLGKVGHRPFDLGGGVTGVLRSKAGKNANLWQVYVKGRDAAV